MQKHDHDKDVMSKSKIQLQLHYAMLDGREECVPEMIGWTAGHVQFKSGTASLVAKCPSSWTFDELDEKYDREKWVQFTVDEIKQELNSERGDRLLKSMVGRMFDLAKEHCDTTHQEYRKQKFPPRKGH